MGAFSRRDDAEICGEGRRRRAGDCVCSPLFGTVLHYVLRRSQQQTSRSRTLCEVIFCPTFGCPYKITGGEGEERGKQTAGRRIAGGGLDRETGAEGGDCSPGESDNVCCGPNAEDGDSSGGEAECGGDGSWTPPPLEVGVVESGWKGEVAAEAVSITEGREGRGADGTGMTGRGRWRRGGGGGMAGS